MMSYIKNNHPDRWQDESEADTVIRILCREISIMITKTTSSYMEDEIMFGIIDLIKTIINTKYPGYYKEIDRCHLYNPTMKGEDEYED